MQQTLLVTGLSGLVGTRLTQLYGHKFEFDNMDLTTGVDITNTDQVEKSVANSKAETIIHLAAFTNVSAAHEQDGDREGVCYQVNVVGTENLVAAAQKHGKYLMHVSTDFVFDGTKNGVYTEEDTPNPIEWYGKTKYMAEQLVEQFDQSVILRISYPYQARPMRPDFLKNMMDKLKDGTLPPPFTDHVITPTFVDDIVAVFDYCAKNRPHGLYHLVGSSSLTDFDIAQLVNRTFELGADIKPGSLESYLKTTNRPYQKSLRTSNAKLQQDFGMEMKTFEAGLREIKRQLDI